MRILSVRSWLSKCLQKVPVCIKNNSIDQKLLKTNPIVANHTLVVWYALIIGFVSLHSINCIFEQILVEAGDSSAYVLEHYPQISNVHYPISIHIGGLKLPCIR